MTEKTTRVPSGDGTGDPTRFMRKIASCVRGFFADSDGAPAARRAPSAEARTRTKAGNVRGMLMGPIVRWRRRFTMPLDRPNFDWGQAGGGMVAFAKLFDEVAAL